MFSVRQLHAEAIGLPGLLGSESSEADEMVKFSG